MPYRIAYLVSGEGRLFEATINAQRLGLLPIEITRVIASGPCPAIDRARRAGIAVDLVDRAAHADRALFDAALNDAILGSGADGAVMNFDFILKGTAVNEYWGRLLNTHFSLLPLFPGFRAIEQAKSAGVRFSGVTVHLVDAGMDTGPIVSQTAVPIDPQADVATLGRDLFHAAVPLQLQALAFLAAGRIHICDERQVTIVDATYTRGPFSPNLESPFRNLPKEVMRHVLEPMPAREHS